MQCITYSSTFLAHIHVVVRTYIGNVLKVNYCEYDQLAASHMYEILANITLRVLRLVRRHLNAPRKSN